MAKLLKLRRGTTTQHGSFTGAEGEVTIDTDKDVPVVHDGSTAGGHPVAAEDMSNVTAANIKGRIASTITNSEVNSSAAIAGTKISPDFGSQNVVTTGTLGSGDITISDNNPSITFTEGDANPDYRIISNNGNLTIQDIQDSYATRFQVNSDGHVDVTGSLDTGDITITNANPTITFTENDGNPDFRIIGNNGSLAIQDIQDSYAVRFQVNSDGHVDVTGNLDVGAGVDVTGNITATGTVDGVDVATRDTLFGGLTSSSGVLSNGVTATTQAQSDNTTKVSTTAYVRTAISEAQAFPSGTKMLFQQTSAPTGWTKVTSGVNNHALRVVSGSAGSGGNVAFTTAFAARGITGNSGNTTAGGNVSVANSTAGGNISVANANISGNVNNHTLSVNEMPSHSHNYARCVQGGNTVPWQANFKAADNGNGTTSNTGGGGGHSHGFSGSAHSHNASFSGSAHNHNASFSGSAHNHSISINNLDMQVEYIDVIIASKD
tara:strand:- start:1731 stop:3203 length:1473 start_codon:yes stop_codon:yes gene_type:complete